MLSSIGGEMEVDYLSPPMLQEEFRPRESKLIPKIRILMPSARSWGSKKQARDEPALLRVEAPPWKHLTAGRRLFAHCEEASQTPDEGERPREVKRLRQFPSILWPPPPSPASSWRRCDPGALPAQGTQSRNLRPGFFSRAMRKPPRRMSPFQGSSSAPTQSCCSPGSYPTRTSCRWENKAQRNRDSALLLLLLAKKGIARHPDSQLTVVRRKGLVWISSGRALVGVGR
uniref:uncharacterized protein LOC123463398 n=1 Tax=Jaculus jaculus TaxID=51337 RepID=UPI001E1B2AB5|nr:uncharacterized protein LOC123463398 [Jaculus jaculus]